MGGSFKTKAAIKPSGTAYPHMSMVHGKSDAPCNLIPKSRERVFKKVRRQNFIFHPKCLDPKAYGPRIYIVKKANEKFNPSGNAGCQGNAHYAQFGSPEKSEYKHGI